MSSPGFNLILISLVRDSYPPIRIINRTCQAPPSCRSQLFVSAFAAIHLITRDNYLHYLPGGRHIKVIFPSGSAANNNYISMFIYPQPSLTSYLSTRVTTLQYYPSSPQLSCAPPQETSGAELRSLHTVQRNIRPTSSLGRHILPDIPWTSGGLQLSI